MQKEAIDVDNSQVMVWSMQRYEAFATKQQNVL